MSWLTPLTSTTTQRVLKHLGVSVLLVLFLYGLTQFFVKQGERLGREWVRNLRPGDISSAARLTLDKCHGTSEEERSLLQTQLNEIGNRAKHHLDVAIYFFTRVYMAVMAFSIAAGIAAIVLAVISKKGLDQTSEYLITIFLVMTAVAIFYQAFPGVFQQKQNVDNNRALYVKYINLWDDIIVYCSTGEVAIKEPKLIIPTGQTIDAKKAVKVEPFTAAVSAKQFVHYINHQMKTFNDIAIGIDESKAARFAKEQFQIQ